MPKLTVLVDRYTWQTPIEGRADRYDFHVAVRGEQIEVSDAEAKRGRDLKALGDAGDLAVATSAAGVPTLSDEQLRSMRADELIAHMGQHPTEAERVVALEEAGRGRKTVLEAGARIIDERDAEAERLADEEQRRREEAAALAAAGAAPTLPG